MQGSVADGIPQLVVRTDIVLHPLSGFGYSPVQATPRAWRNH